MIAEGVVGIVVKTVVFPERVELERHLARAAAQSPERRDVLISDFERLKRLGQGVTVILRIGARARHGADVDNECYRNALQEFDDVVQRPRPMV